MVYQNPAGWRVELNGVTLSGGDLTLHPGEVSGVLTSAPDGLGLPDIRTEDVTYAQRDGVRQFRDWYGARVVTLENVVIHGAGCSSQLELRKKVRSVMQAWARSCGPSELVIWTPGHDATAVSDSEEDLETRSLVGPFGITGRPRQALLTWDSVGVARLTLRFDATDQRLFVLNARGEAGSGEECKTIVLLGRAPMWCYDADVDGTPARCYDDEGVGRCFTVGDGDDLVTTTINAAGTECVFPSITLNGPLTRPVLTNLENGSTLSYNGRIRDGQKVVLNSLNLTARFYPNAEDPDTSENRTFKLDASGTFGINPGQDVRIRLQTDGAETGTVQLCYRPTVLFA